LSGRSLTSESNCDPASFLHFNIMNMDPRPLLYQCVSVHQLYQSLAFVVNAMTRTFPCLPTKGCIAPCPPLPIYGILFVSCFDTSHRMLRGFLPLSLSSLFSNFFPCLVSLPCADPIFFIPFHICCLLSLHFPRSVFAVCTYLSAQYIHTFHLPTLFYSFYSICI
jgi:hypothetical protein